jgi:uncharacterized membrane protein
MMLIKRYRPLGILLLEIIVLGNAFWNGLRLTEAIYFRKTLEIYGASLQYIALSGGFWFISAISLGIGIWYKRIWAWPVSIVGITSYCTWYWIDRLYLQVPHSNWLYSLVVTIVLAVILISILLSAKARRYFYKLET